MGSQQVHPQSAALPSIPAQAELRIPSLTEIWLRAIGSGVIVFSVSLLGQWLIYNQVRGEDGLRYFGAGIAGVVTIGLTYRLQIVSRERKVNLLRRLAVLAELNHHIRNSLQVLSYQTATTDPDTTERLRDAVERIEWVLNELLPGMEGKERDGT